MIAILKYYIFFRHGLPMLGGGIAFMLLTQFVFADSGIGQVILILLMFPYLDMFSSYNEVYSLRSIDTSLPLSFNKIWLAKSICLGIYFIILSLVYYYTNFVDNPEILTSFPKFMFFGVVMFMMLFVMGKYKLYTKGNKKLIILTAGSVAVFILILVGIKLLMDIIPEDEILLSGLATFVLPIAFVHLFDYAFAKSNKLYALGGK